MLGQFDEAMVGQTGEELRGERLTLCYIALCEEQQI